MKPVRFEHFLIAALQVHIPQASIFGPLFIKWALLILNALMDTMLSEYDYKMYL